MKNRYTKGPWVFDPSTLDSRTLGYCILDSTLTETICAVEAVDGEGPDSVNERRMADARLIASAPEMLELLESIDELFDGFSAITPLHLEIKKVIRRAVGDLQILSKERH